MPGIALSASETMFLLIGLLLGLVIAGAASVWIARRRLGEARDAGRSEREPELAVLARDLQALADQRDELRLRLAALDTDYAKSIKLTDRNGQAGTKRNDGTPVAQVTPAYLMANALLGIDLAFDKYEEQNPNDKERRANWRRARSQLVDQFLGTTGIQSNSAFASPTVPNPRSRTSRKPASSAMPTARRGRP